MIDSIDAAIEAAIAATSDRDRAQIVVRHAWLQKHPSPAANSGEFHWYPVGGDRDLRAELAERGHGIEPPAVLWGLAPGRVVWARAFGAEGITVTTSAEVAPAIAKAFSIKDRPVVLHCHTSADQMSAWRRRK